MYRVPRKRYAGAGSSGTIKFGKNTLPDGKITDRGFRRTSNLYEDTNSNDVLNRVVWLERRAPGRLTGRQPFAIRIFVFNQKIPTMQKFTRSARIFFSIPL